MSEWPDDQADAPPLPPVETIECWRCGGSVAATIPQCPHCAAPLSTTSDVAAPAPRSPRASTIPIFRVIGVFAIFLLVSVVLGLSLRVNELLDPGGVEPSARELLGAITVAECIDTVLVLVALAWIPVHRRWTVSPGRRVSAWGLFVPIIAGILALNVGYHWLLREMLELPLLETKLFDQPELFGWWIMVICIQPAVVEELFFRYLALDVFRSLLGVHTAVFVSSIMFGLAHIGSPLSIPMLVVLGVSLGYARVASGGIALPMLMHFLHNATVLGIDWYLTEVL